jgi:hypothetical protein
VLFLLEGPAIDTTVKGLLRDLSVWRSAAAWRSCLASPPTLASAAYSWTSDSANP